MTTVYLAGPIHGREDCEVIEWREQATLILEKVGIEVRNPLDRDFRGREIECINEIVLLDKRDIRKSDAVLVWWDGTASVGTSMEVFFAHSIDKPIVLLNYYGLPMSPWLTYHRTVEFGSVTDAREWIKRHVK